MPQSRKTKKEKLCKGLNQIKCCKLFKVIRFAVNQQAIKVKATPNKKLCANISCIYTNSICTIYISIDDFSRLITQFDAEKFAQSDAAKENLSICREIIFENLKTQFGVAIFSPVSVVSCKQTPVPHFPLPVGSIRCNSQEVQPVDKVSFESLVNI